MSAIVFSLKVLASGTRRLCRSICCSLKHSFPVSSHTHTFSSSDTCENAWKPVSSPCTSASRCEKKSLPVWSQRRTMPDSSLLAAAVLETMVACAAATAVAGAKLAHSRWEGGRQRT
eukprot:scaffold86881_cov40-Phaeocystis_antarctica.AAC.3